MNRGAPSPVLRAGHAPEDLEELTNVGRDSVEAIHHFLPLDVIDKLEPLIREEYLPRLRLRVAERNGAVLGFIGLDKHQVAMLFIADEARSRGIGNALLDWAKTQFPQLSLDVNEQNPRAAVLYIKRGFSPVGRTETDIQGLPFPLLQLRWDAAEEVR